MSDWTKNALMGPQTTNTLWDQQQPFYSPGQPTSTGIFDDAVKQYPILGKQNIDYAYQPKGVKSTGMLEMYPPGEEDRPAGMPVGRTGLAIFDPKTKPSDVLADWTSHVGRKSDPNIKQHYDAFVKSMTPQQKEKLQGQYQWAQSKEGEKRPFDKWAEQSGIPAWYRGALFNQWPQQFVQSSYTPEQLQQLSSIKPYLGMQQP